MAKTKLTDLALKNLRPPAEGQAEYWDENLSNFGVRVSPGGTKSFVLYINRRRKVIGRYPRMSLKEARAEAMRVLHDPVGYARSQHIDVSYAEAVERYLNMKQGEVRPRTLEGYAHLLRMFEFPELVADIRPYHVGDALDRIEQQTKKSNAYTALKMFFNWCVAREYCPTNPLQNLKKPKVPASRDRVLTDNELAAIWQACEKLGKYGLIVQVLMVTGQRREQIASLHTSWIKDDWVTFPADVMKGGKRHEIPLARLAAEALLRAIPMIDGYYFSPVTAVGRPFSAWSKSKAKLDSMIDIDPWRLHVT
ncbi:MAG: integrase family protein [Alphaproteobacteria bacterium]|nr:integrase family protein [Alphaproteobacteria bacterium]